MMPKTAILILAAGESKRMGEPKQLLPYNNSTLLLHSIEQVNNIKYSDVFIVIGAHFADVFKSIRGQKATILKNNNWEDGMGSSLSKGIELIKKKKNYDRVLVTLADTPLVNTEHYEELISFSDATGKRIILTNYEEVSGVPAIFDKSLFNELSLLSDNEGAKPVVKKYKKEVLKMNSKIPFFDIDTKEAYQKLLNLS
ncbi:nucleotidyltransferase family protein [Flavobacteriaceae bacterium]|nr:nucleotidyltransferase family protein [Flavobacteriaceae bacterium]MDB2685394.1 nucleotidyltransferase family protein [Flavobacteriaceae bacterium]MDB4256617.1 nucleotidyltransferase family protein [Flavobacteriaceae bacterium]